MSGMTHDCTSRATGTASLRESARHSGAEASHLVRQALRKEIPHLGYEAGALVLALGFLHIAQRLAIIDDAAVHADGAQHTHEQHKPRQHEQYLCQIANAGKEHDVADGKARRSKYDGRA